MARITFNSVFRQHTDGSLEPNQRIRVGGVTFGPGVRLSRGVQIAGIDFTQFINRDLEVDTDGDILVVKGVY
jgi:hypothetical protein